MTVIKEIWRNQIKFSQNNKIAKLVYIYTKHYFEKKSGGRVKLMEIIDWEQKDAQFVVLLIAGFSSEKSLMSGAHFDMHESAALSETPTPLKFIYLDELNKIQI